MVDPKESPEIPESADPSLAGMDAADSAKPASQRDPILEELLRSKSSDDSEPAGRLKRAKRQKKVRTGTSLDRKSRRRSLPLIGAVAAGVLLIGGAGAGLWYTLSPSDGQIDPDRNSGRTQSVTGREADADAEAKAPWNDQSEDGLFPIALDSWQKEQGTYGISPEAQDALFASMSGTSFGISAGTLPSEAAGFTSNDEQIFLEDGSLNPLYSFWTQEAFVKNAGQIIERFLNPRFGGWEQYQGRGADPNSIDAAAIFPGTFTTEFLEKGTPVREWLPIFADWDNNNYGRSDLSVTGPRWYGEIKGSTSEFVWNEEEQQYSVNFKADVKFTAYKSNSEKVSEKGTLELNFVANPRSEKGNGGKVLVNGSKLTIGG